MRLSWLAQNAYAVTASAWAALTVTPWLFFGLGTTNLDSTTGCDLPWFCYSSGGPDGSAFTSSGRITHGQTSFLETHVSGPGAVSFWWMVSSEQYYDFLNFYVDDGLVAGISGDVGWEQRNFALPSGAHALRWSYEKDNTVSAGQDSGRLAQVVFTPAQMAFFVSITANGELVTLRAWLPTGLHYALEYQDHFGAASWWPLTNAVGQGAERVFFDTLQPDGSRFYRLRQTAGSP